MTKDPAGFLIVALVLGSKVEDHLFQKVRGLTAYMHLPCQRRLANARGTTISSVRLIVKSLRSLGCAAAQAGRNARALHIHSPSLRRNAEAP